MVRQAEQGSRFRVSSLRHRSAKRQQRLAERCARRSKVEPGGQSLRDTRRDQPQLLPRLLVFAVRGHRDLNAVPNEIWTRPKSKQSSRILYRPDTAPPSAAPERLAERYHRLPKRGEPDNPKGQNIPPPPRQTAGIRPSTPRHHPPTDPPIYAHARARPLTLYILESMILLAKKSFGENSIILHVDDSWKCFRIWCSDKTNCGFSQTYFCV